jgi:hypothetical protein
MAQILITNYTGTVTSDIVVYETVGTCPSCSPGTAYNLASLYGAAGQIGPTTSLPAFYTLPNNFDWDPNCFVQLSASTTLFTVPQLTICGVEPPQTFGFESCGQPLNKNIYVFYDTSGSYPDGINFTGYTYETLSGASQSIRDWYYNLVTNSGYTGNLYEIPVANERYINWACYPYLGSTTGGTLSDSSTLQIQMGRITHANNYPGGGQTTAPIWTSPIIDRIALGKNLATGAPLPASPGYSLGVPFNHANYTAAGCVTGQFAGGDTNYIALIVLNEVGQLGSCSPLSTNGGPDFMQPYFSFNADSSNTRFYHRPNTSGSINPQNPLSSIYTPNDCGPAWSNTTSSIQRDYEAWIKVWEDVNVNANGFTKAFLFPVPTRRVTAGIVDDPQLMALLPNITRYDGASQGYGTLYQAIEIIEGEIPQAPSYFQSNYCEGIFGTTGTQWPYPNGIYNQYSAYTYCQGQYYDFSPLSYYNQYTGFTATTAYSMLPTQYKNGPGLKNFGWTVDSTITGFTQALVENDLNGYLNSVLAGTKIYTTTEPSGVNEGSVYTIQDFEGCWTYTGPRLDGQPSYEMLETIYEFVSCEECQGDVDPQIVAFKYTGFKYSFDSALITSTGVTQDATIAIHGMPNDDITVDITWPLSLGTDIPSGVFQLNYPSAWTTYPLGSSTAITVTLDTNGVFELEWRWLNGGTGYEYINFEITNSTSGATISPTLSNQYLTNADGNPLSPDPETYSLILCKFAPGSLSNNIMVVGESTVTATTSGDACTSFSIQQSYLIQGIENGASYTDILTNDLITNPLVLKNAQTLSVINGTNNWIAVTIGMYYVDGYSFEKIALQVDSSGNIITIAQCS